MSTTIPQSSATELVRLANCPHCWQRPGRPCTGRCPVSAELNARRTAAAAVLGDYRAAVASAPLTNPPGREWMLRLASVLGDLLAAHDEDARRLDAIRGVLAGFDWEYHDRQLALEAIERIADGGEQ